MCSSDLAKFPAARQGALLFRDVEAYGLGAHGLGYGGDSAPAAKGIDDPLGILDGEGAHDPRSDYAGAEVHSLTDIWATG